MMASDGKKGPVRVLLTGATGFIGGRALERVLDQEDRVRALALPGTEKDLRYPDRVEVVTGNLENEALLNEAVRGVETVYHMGALLPGSPYADLMKVNVHGTENLLRACGRAGGVKRFVFTSSVAVYGDTYSLRAWPMNEDAKLQPVGSEGLRDYGRTKVAAESLIKRYAREFGFEYTILRCEAPYGVGGSLTETLLRLALIGPGTDNGQGWLQRMVQPIHVRDVAKGLVLAAAHPKGKNEIFNLAGSEVVTFADMVTLIHRLVKKGEPTACRPDQSRIWRRYLLMYDTGKAEQWLGFSPAISLHEGLAEVAEVSGWRRGPSEERKIEISS
jgi:nucleoside-diphosphate-sugar epimerase